VIYYIVNAGMTVAAALFLVGYFLRIRNNRAHRVIMSSAVAATVLAALALVFAVHFLYGGDRVLAGFIPTVPDWVVLAHRITASIAFTLMLAMAWTGATRRRALHIALHAWFLALFMAVYISGLLIFTNTP
jgi:hypothetical protein